MSSDASSPLATLVVEPDRDDMVFVTSALTSAGFAVTGVSTYEEARALMASNPPDVLLTEVRLRAYNGLQLAFRGRLARPHMTIVLTSAFEDPVLQRDIDRMGATFVIKPVTGRELVAAICRTALRRPRADGTFEPIHAPFERRMADRRQSRAEASVEVERRHTERRIATPTKRRGLSLT